MVTGSYEDYRVSEHYQAKMRHQAEQYRAAQEASQGIKVTSRRAKWIARMVLVTLVLLSIFLGISQASAQGVGRHQQDAGSTFEPFPEAILAYRLGNYYLVEGDTEQAVEKLSEAIALIPVEVFARMPEYSVMYWALGEAQEQAGMAAEALVSFRQAVALVGDDVAPWALAKVQELEGQVEIVQLVSASFWQPISRG